MSQPEVLTLNFFNQFSMGKTKPKILPKTKSEDGARKKSPSRTQSPSRKAHSPSRKAHSPSRKAQSPSGKAQSPSRKAQSPSGKAQSPSRKAQSPTRIPRSSSRRARSPVARKNSSSSAPLRRSTRSPNRNKTTNDISTVRRVSGRSPIRFKKETTEVEDNFVSLRKSKEKESSPLTVFHQTLRSTVRKAPSLLINEDNSDSDREFDINFKLRSRTLRSSYHSEPVYNFESKLSYDDDDDDKNSGIINRIRRSMTPLIKFKSSESNKSNQKIPAGDDFSEDDEEQEENEKKKFSFESDVKPDEFFGIKGATLLMVLMPLMMLLYFEFCNETRCNFMEVPYNLKKYLKIGTYFDPLSALIVFTYFILMLVLSLLTPGMKYKKMFDLGGFTYKFNGFLTFFVILLTISALEYSGQRIASYVIGHSFHMLISFFILGLVTSTYVFVRSYYVDLKNLNPYAIGKRSIYSFFIGREINPKILFDRVDLKLLTFRCYVVGNILIDLMYIYKSQITWSLNSENKTLEWHFSGLKSYTFYVYFALDIFYYFDKLIFEKNWITTMMCNKDGYGYFYAITYFTLPIINSVTTMYVVDYGVDLNNYLLLLVVVTFLIGYVFFRMSNLQKHRFRLNQYNPGYKAIPTSRGKKLLMSGVWGKMRHPNYIGDIIMHISFVPFVIFVPPVLLIAIFIVSLLFRSKRDFSQCKLKYGTAFDRYSEAVPYQLIPRIY